MENGEPPLDEAEPMKSEHPLKFEIIAECETSDARCAQMHLPHYSVATPIFMPVGTQGTMKGLTTEQLLALDCQIILANTYHLGMRPGAELLDCAGGLHKWMGWTRAMLTDSGGFQMVSLVELSEVTEEGVKFRSPYDGKEVMLTPERSMEIQHSIGADIMMQLDDVIDVSITGPRVEEAMLRSVRWLDRCIAQHRATPHACARQTLFPIIQGGLDLLLRERCINEMVKRDAGGYAIGGLSGGEEKQAFWRTVHFCAQRLPRDRPRYVMGVGYAVDLVVCAALGADMFDCVYPTRTARFGTALLRSGQLNLKSKVFEGDRRPIDADCECGTCRKYTRAFLHSVVGKEPSSCHLVTVHNIAFQMKLMEDVRMSICGGTFPEFVRMFMREMYAGGDLPQWVVDALAAVNIQL